MTPASSAATLPGTEDPVTRDDLESKMRELQRGVDDTADSARGVLVAAGAAAALGVVVVVFLIGRRSGRKKTTVVEVRRV